MKASNSCRVLIFRKSYRVSIFFSISSIKNLEKLTEFLNFLKVIEYQKQKFLSSIKKFCHLSSLEFFRAYRVSPLKTTKCQYYIEVIEFDPAEKLNEFQFKVRLVEFLLTL